MIIVDGSKGGGQILRTALSFAVIKGKDVKLTNIRANRSNPGLKNQHLACIKAAKKVSNAEVSGAEIGSKNLVFKPSGLVNDFFEINIGTAGSLTLLMDTVIPITSQFDDSFELSGKGGTDVKWSPTVDYLKNVKLPLLRNIGFKGKVDIEKIGYYPEGGGRITLETSNHSLEKINITEKGVLQGIKIYSKASKDLESSDVAERQANVIERKVENSRINCSVSKNISYEETDSTGSSVTVRADYENSITGFDALGEKGKSAEEVGKEAFKSFNNFHSQNGAVDSYMGDQFLVFLGLIGGRLRVPELTRHLKTNLEVLRKFGVEFEVTQEADSVLLEAFT